MAPKDIEGVDDFINLDHFMASVVRFLLDGGDYDAAAIVLSCKFSAENEVHHFETDWLKFVDLCIEAPRFAYDILTAKGHDDADLVYRAIHALRDERINEIIVRASVSLDTLGPNWREELLEIAKGKAGINQAVDPLSGRLITWKNLRFRSATEVKIAEALERAGVLFWPNCMARICSPADGAQAVNREADFLVCYGGKFGILEVDGDAFHPPERASKDHERDRLFRSHGIIVVERFNATECYQQPDIVVRKFLDIVTKAK